MSTATDHPINLISHPNKIEFGQSVEGTAQIVVTCDLFGFHPLYFDEHRGGYGSLPAAHLWRLALSDCSNINEALNITVPKIGELQRYRESGFDSLGYAALAFDRPELSEYLDNPGIMVLLLANSRAATSVLCERPNRVDLVRRLTGNALIKQPHINWLKKVRPGQANPVALAREIRHSILQIPATNFQSDSYEKQFYKLFAHQPRWTPEGLAFARMLVGRRDVDPTDLVWLLEARNGVDHAQRAAAASALEQFMKHPLAPNLMIERANELIRNQDRLSPALCKRINGAATRDSMESLFRHYAPLLLVDDDIPAPIIRGDHAVKALDTLAKIRRHARVAKNCLWTLEMIASVLSRHIDLYSVAGENHYTFSINRQTLDIHVLETAKSPAIKPADLGLIAQWFEEGTRLPR